MSDARSELLSLAHDFECQAIADLTDASQCVEAVQHTHHMLTAAMWAIAAGRVRNALERLEDKESGNV